MLVTLLIGIFLSTNVFALGITPGRTTLEFQSGATQEISFSIVNTEHKDMSVVFSVGGELADYITLNQAYAEFSSEEESKSFSYTIKFPDKLESPGTHEAEIVALEMPKNFMEGGATVGATVSVVTQLHVNVPYPNKYAEADLNIVEDDAGKVVFLIPVVNKGKIDIVNCKAVINVQNGLGEKVTTIESSSKQIKSLSREELVAEIEDLDPGKYKALATIIYDDEIINLEKEFEVGVRVLDIVELVVEDFSLGSIAKFEALVENKWQIDLKDVFLNILVYDDEGGVMANFESQTYDLSALSSMKMIAYWDTAGVREGTYDSDVVLKYGDKSIDRNVQMKITDSSIEVVGLTGKVIVRGGGDFNLNNILVILVIILVVANIFWFVVIKRILKKKGGKD